MSRPAIHPGEQLAEELKALGMNAAELARQMRVPTNRVTEILNGQRALPAIPRCAWDTSSAQAPNSSSTFTA